ncbi:MAG: SCP2 sterol-binding domain-containing protein [Pseudomonadota bacterium]
MSPEISSLLTAAIEKLINGALRYDPASLKQLASIDKILAIESTAPSLTLYIRGSAEGVYISAHCESPVSTHLRGSPLALLTLLKQPTNLSGSGVELEGNIGLLQQWQQLLSQLDIDWEDAISQILGDIAGPAVAQGLRSSFSWVITQQHEQQRLFKDYVEEELKLVPSKAEVLAFANQVFQLQQDLDRLQARSQILFEQHLPPITDQAPDSQD